MVVLDGFSLGVRTKDHRNMGVQLVPWWNFAAIMKSLGAASWQSNDKKQSRRGTRVVEGSLRSKQEATGAVLERKQEHGEVDELLRMLAGGGRR